MKLKVGDVFTIPVGESLLGFGQIVEIPNKSNFVIIVFKKCHRIEAIPTIDEIIGDEILFFGYTMDALLYHKHWKIIGNASSNLNQISKPYYKLGTPPDCKLVDFTGKVLGKISQDKFMKLKYQQVIAPIRYQNALKAYYKLDPWRDDYDELLYDNVTESINVVGEN